MVCRITKVLGGFVLVAVIQKQSVAEIYIWRSLLHNEVITPFFFAEATIIGHTFFDMPENFMCLMLEAVWNIWVRCSTIVMHDMRGFPGRWFPGIWHPGLDTDTSTFLRSLCWKFCVCVCVCTEQETVLDKHKQQITVGPPQVLYGSKSYIG